MCAPTRLLILWAIALAGPVMGSVARRQNEVAAASAAAAAAATPEYEFIPSPGMPSLESLGLSAADLFNKTWVDELFKDTPNPVATTSNNGTFSASWVASCDRDSRDLAPVNAIRACAAYLWALNRQACVGKNHPVQFVKMREGNYHAVVHGISVRSGPATSYCRDCASPVYWVADHCVAGCDPPCVAGGSEAAYGNGDLIMVVSGNFS